MAEEKDSSYYDKIFSEKKEFQVSYRDTPYWVQWTQVINFLGQDKDQRILEIGCGTGQFAEFLLDEGFKNYLGFDFGERAIKLAKERVPDFSFVVSDALSGEVYKNAYDTVICLEVLEHIKNDLNVLMNIEEGKIIIFSLPNFYDNSHIRWFISERQIKKRYYKLLDIQRMVRIGNIYVCRAVRSNFKPDMFQKIVKTRESFKVRSITDRLKHYQNNIKTIFQQ